MYVFIILPKGGCVNPYSSGATAPIQLCVLHKRVNKTFANVTANVSVPLHALLAVAYIASVKALSS